MFREPLAINSPMDMVNLETWNEWAPYCLWEFYHLRRFDVPQKLLVNPKKFPVCAFI